MSDPGPEWLLWAKRFRDQQDGFRDQHDDLSRVVESLSRTVATVTEDLRISQQAREEDVKVLTKQVQQLQDQQQQQASEIASLRAENTEISGTLSQQNRVHEQERIRTLTKQLQELRAQQEQQAAVIASLQEENLKTAIAARERRGTIAVNEAQFVASETGLTSPLNGQYSRTNLSRHTLKMRIATSLASLSAASPFDQSMQEYRGGSATRDRNFSREASPASSLVRFDSEETRDSTKTPESRRKPTSSKLFHFLNTPEPQRHSTRLETFDFPKTPEPPRSLTSSEFTNATPPNGQSINKTIARPLFHKRGNSLFSDLSENFSDDSFTYVLEKPEAQVEARSMLIPSQPAVALKSQQGTGLAEYMMQSGLHIEEQKRSYEKQLVKAFIAGMDDEEEKSALETSLEQQGYTWQVVSKAVGQVLKDAAIKTAPATPSPKRNAKGRFTKKRQKRN